MKNNFKIKNILKGGIILAMLFTLSFTPFSFGLYAQEKIKIPADGSVTNPPVDGRVTNTGAETNKTFPKLQNPLKAKNLTEAIYTVVDIIIFLGVIVAVLMFIFIGFKFVLAQGDSTKLKEARMWFLYAVIGTAILISSKVIVEVIKNTAVSTGLVNEQLFKKP